MTVTESSVTPSGRRYGVVVRAVPDRRRYGVDTFAQRSYTADTVTVLEGTPGKSAYELAVEAGYEGTEAEWVMGQIPTKVMTQAEYSALAGVREPNTLYIVTA
jgi:hypothetical protein